MRRLKRDRRRGIAIALVMFFVIVLLLFVSAMTFTRVERKRQAKQSLTYLKAHFFARGALQHALLKIRILPNEVFDASCLQRGLCPFFRFDTTSISVGTDDGGAAMDVFRADLNTISAKPNGVPIQSALGDYTGWEAEVPQIEAVTSVIRGDDMVHVIEITAKAVVPDPLSPTGGNRVEIVKKTIEIVRQRS